MPRKLLEAIERGNKKRCLFKKGDSLVVGVSGGPDSMALLAILHKLSHKYCLRLTVAHLNHGLLAMQSKRHAGQVKSYCQKLGVPFYIKKISLKELSKKSGRSLEETGRLERYRFFESVALRTASKKIATAHTLNDQAETMLMRIFRGSGLKGLVGIPHKRALGKLEVIRPLLNCEKKDLLAFLKQNRIPYSIDKTNDSCLFTRNRVRHDLLPQIAKRFNPQIKRTLANLQTVCEEVAHYIDQASAKGLRKSLRRKTGRKRTISLKSSVLKHLHPAIQREVLLKALELKKGDLKRVGFAHVSAIWEMLESPETNLQLQLPGPVRVKKTNHSLDFTS